MKKEKEKRKGITKADREAAAYFHKVHLLALYMHVWNVNKWMDDENLQVHPSNLFSHSKAMIFSVVPTFLHEAIEPEETNLVTISMLIDWFRNYIKIAGPNVFCA